MRMVRLGGLRGWVGLRLGVGGWLGGRVGVYSLFDCAGAQAGRKEECTGRLRVIALHLGLHGWHLLHLGQWRAWKVMRFRPLFRLTEFVMCAAVLNAAFASRVVTPL